MPGDFREMFDLQRLDERDLGQIEFVLNSPAYTETFRPYLQGILNRMQDLWKDRSRQRKDQYPDDFLAGGVCVVEGLLEFFGVLIQETNVERIHASMSNVTNETLYDAFRQSVRFQPVVGLDQSATPETLDPAEDF